MRLNTDLNRLHGTVVESRSLTGELSLSALDLQQTGDQLCG